MAVDLDLKLTDRELQAGLERLRLGLPLGGDMTPAMRGLGRILKSGAQMRFREGKGPDGRPWVESWRAKEDGGQTLRDTSRLQRSINFEAAHDKVAVGTNVLYARIHQLGGIIRARNAKFLAVPMTKQARAAGSPRNLNGLALAQSLRGQMMLVEAQTGLTHYLLKKQVKMPARPYLGVSDTDRGAMLATMSDFLERAWDRR